MTAIADIAKGLEKFISADVRGRGEAYLRAGRVRLIDGGPTSCAANVKGGNLYDVECSIDADAPRTVFCFCSCPYTTSTGEPCKHIWATILAGLAKGWLTGRDNKPPLEVALDPAEYDFAGSYEDEDDERPHDEYDEFSDDGPPPREFRQRPAPARRPPRKPAKPEWQQRLESIAVPNAAHQHRGPVDNWSNHKQIIYVFDPAYMVHNALTVQVMHRERKLNGDWSAPRNGGPADQAIPRLPDPADREICAALIGATPYCSAAGTFSGNTRYQLTPVQIETLLPRMLEIGRCLWKLPRPSLDYLPLQWDKGEPWSFTIVMAKVGGKSYQLSGSFVRGDDRRAVNQARWFSCDGIVIFEDAVARLDDRNAPGWLRLFRDQAELNVPVKQLDQFLKQAFSGTERPPLELPADVQIAVVAEAPKPVLHVCQPTYGYQPGKELEAEARFQYGEFECTFASGRAQEYDAKTRTLHLRQTDAERACLERLIALRLRRDPYSYGNQSKFRLPTKDLPNVARTLTAEGWRVEAEGKLFRSAGKFELNVSSGIDWFELQGTVDFGGVTVPLPKILAALRRQQTTVDLGDGAVGMLPEDWLIKYGLLASVGAEEAGHIRFRRNQVGLLDALLAAQPDVEFDATFRQARDEFRDFSGIQPAEPPESFTGQLRPYQSDGLGWLQFLRRFGFGGCLADDMGLGKTVQVLAMLADRKATRPKREPRTSLVVVPKSLVFNWKQEAARFAPDLRVLNQTGTERSKDLESLRAHDVVLTTYGTLRNDAALFQDFEFDYCILDESQAVKNARTESAKAVRLLRGRHRLAISGTPIENHLGELWSLFDYLNPGMLGHAAAFKAIAGAGRNPDPAARAILAKALRPFILRRTKDQVAKDLPQKTEQTVFCDLDDAQRQVYSELRDYYRQALLKKVEADGLAKSKIMVLEALLRLRQAACHPGLLDKGKATDSSAKLDVLLPKLQEVFEEGHKALVFSQFTQLLGLVKKRLDAANVPYEYLDGKTRDRQARVERFQNDPNCMLFLISLKAGGLGLNLTAAEYVFLLDPWWNPAVEAQAIDRTHRIGQTRPVFAYRLIARDTVEEKVLALQETKKALADAIITADNSLIRDLKKEDLEILLS